METSKFFNHLPAIMIQNHLLGNMKKLTPQEIWVNYIIPALEEKPVPDDALEVLKHTKRKDFDGISTYIDVNVIDVDICLETAINRNNNLMAMAALLAGANANEEVWGGHQNLCTAAAYGNIEIVKMLLEYGADIDTKNESDIDTDSALHKAADYGYVELAEFLLSHGANVNIENSNGATPLYKAASNGHTKVVELLLNRGAILNPKGQNESPLYPAAFYGWVETVELLLNRGAEVDGNLKKCTPLHAAAETGRAEVAALLLKHHADINKQSARGSTPLHIACTFSQIELAALLLAHGANFHITNYERKTPLKIIDDCDQDITSLLESADALQTHNELPKPLIYTAATLAAMRGLNIEAFVQQQEKLFEQAYYNAYPPNKAYNMLHPRPDYQTWLQQQSDALGIIGYADTNNLMDMVKEVADAIVLPQLLPNNIRIAKALSEDEIQELKDIALPIAAAQLFSSLTLPDIFALSNAWHHGKAISTDIRDLKSGKWQVLMEPFTCTKVNPPLTIMALTSTDALKEEGEYLKHCVGDGGYDDGCLEGKHHILSVRSLDGKPQATICVDDNLNILDSQFYGKYNEPPPKEAKAAFAELKEAIKNKQFNLKANTQETWGESEQSVEERLAKRVTKLERTIGYRLVERDTKLQACIDHYRHELKHKVTLPKEERRETLGMQTKKIEERRVMPFNLSSLRLDKDTLADIEPLLSQQTKSVLNAQKHLEGASCKTRDNSSMLAR